VFLFHFAAECCVRVTSAANASRFVSWFFALQTTMSDRDICTPQIDILVRSTSFLNFTSFLVVFISTPFVFT
jgi:hypothetical protein